MKNSFLISLCVFCFFACTEPQARRPLSQKSATIISETIKKNKELIDGENRYIEAYLAKDSISNYKVASSGFWYTYLVEKATDKIVPLVGDEVEISYNITDLRDSVIYSKETLGIKKYVIDKQDFIPALQDGLKLMKVGETITFVIPSYRAFGLVGDGNKIKINQTIKSTVTLINIKQK